MLGGLISSAMCSGVVSGSGGGGGDDDEWTLPESWLPIPEPAANQITMLIEISEKEVNQPSLAIQGSYPGSGPGEMYIDWGDGINVEIDTIDGLYCTHFYTAPGQYIITATFPNPSNITVQTSSNVRAYLTGANFPVNPGTGKYNAANVNSQCHIVRAVKNGASVYNSGLWSEGAGGFTNLVYLKFCGDSMNLYEAVILGNSKLCKIENESLKPLERSLSFMGAYSLKDLDFLNQSEDFHFGLNNNYGIKHINFPKLKTMSTALSYMFGLKTFYAPELTEIPGNCFVYCYNLEEVYTPSVKNVAPDAFSYCYSLKKLTVAEDCNFNGNTFENCPALYPKPQ